MQGFTALAATALVSHKYLGPEANSMQQFLQELECFSNLEIESGAAIMNLEKAPHQTATPTAIIKVLQRAKYSTILGEQDEDGNQPLEFKAPGFHVSVKLTWSADALYPAPPECLALIIAELIDNAAKHLESATNPSDGNITVELFDRTIIVENPILGKSQKSVDSTLTEAAKVQGRSFFRILQLAEMVGSRISWEFPSNGRNVRLMVKPD